MYDLDNSIIIGHLKSGDDDSGDFSLYKIFEEMKEGNRYDE